MIRILNGEFVIGKAGTFPLWADLFCNGRGRGVKVLEDTKVSTTPFKHLT